MEAVELWHAERLSHGEDRCGTASESALWSGHLIDPEADGFPETCAWLPGRDLLSGRATDVPRLFLSLDYTEPDPANFAPISTGLTAGNTKNEAVLAALCEVAERGFMHWFLRASVRERLQRRIDPATASDRRTRWAIDRIGRAGLDLRIWDLGQGTGVASFAACILGGDHGPFPVRPTTGSAAHPIAERALLGALLEAAQIRVTLLAGARDDLRFRDYPASWAKVSEMALGIRLSAGGDPGGEPFRATSMPATIDHAIDQMLQHFSGSGAPVVVAVDHSRIEIGIPVVKVIVPGHPDHERSRK